MPGINELDSDLILLSNAVSQAKVNERQYDILNSAHIRVKGLLDYCSHNESDRAQEERSIGQAEIKEGRDPICGGRREVGNA